MMKKISKIGVCMVFVLSTILPQAAVSKAKTANPYTGKKYVYCSTKTELNSMERMAVKRKSTH